jgi:hypothetical protein
MPSGIVSLKVPAELIAILEQDAINSFVGNIAVDGKFLKKKCICSGLAGNAAYLEDFVSELCAKISYQERETRISIIRLLHSILTVHVVGHGKLLICLTTWSFS